MRVPLRTRQLLLRALAPGYLLLCLVLGGASAAGLTANLLLQLIAIPILCAAFLVDQDIIAAPASRTLSLLAAALIAVFAIQLLPLPPAIWTALPGREAVSAGFAMLGQPLPWLPLSLAPGNTLASLIWLLPAFAVLLAIIRIGAFRATWIAWTIVAVALVSVALGAVQVAGDAGSPAYFYRITNFGQAVGFFSNANHQATLLLITIPFLAALLGRALDRRVVRREAQAQVLLIGAAFLIVAVGLLISGSLAGIGLGIPVAAASVMLVRLRTRTVPVWAAPVLLVLSIGAVALVLSEPFGNNLTSSEAERHPSLSRATSFTNTLAATSNYFPAGSGIGSFLDVYRQQENPAKVITIYMNHAHSDWLEVLLETGILGIVVFLLFLLWFLPRAFAIWRRDDHDPFARAATVAVAAVLAHSVVDYPLRTAAIGAVFATCLALMNEPRERVLARRSSRKDAAAARHVTA